MTRGLTVATHFEQGVLVEASPHPSYGGRGSAHAYYVPTEARKHAGMVKAVQMDSSEELIDERSGPDWDAVENLVSARDLVEQAEQKVYNRTDGDIGDIQRPHHLLRWSRSSDEEPRVPAGVIKFSDPNADEESTIVRDPVERGNCWGTVLDRVVSNTHVKRLQYHNDVRQTPTLDVRVPLSVVKEGKESMIAYLAAHDHADHHIARLLDCDRDTVRAVVEEMQVAD